MRATPFMLAVAEAAANNAPLAPAQREMLADLASSAIKLRLREEDSRLADEAKILDDSERKRLLLELAEASPFGFLVVLPEIIRNNAFGFDDEELLSGAVQQAVSQLLLFGSGGEDRGRTA